VWGRKQERELHAPEDKVGNHLLGCNADGFRDVVRDVEVRGPDGADTLGHGSRTRVGLDGVPEEGGGHADYDGEFGEVPLYGVRDGPSEM
jgi:hypothetical protein